MYLSSDLLYSANVGGLSQRRELYGQMFSEKMRISHTFFVGHFSFGQNSAAHRAGRGPLGSSSVCVGVRGCASACLRGVEITVGPFVARPVCGC